MLKKYISLDIETTGLDPTTCQILEVGMVMDDLETNIDELPQRTLYIVPPNGMIHGQLYAINMNRDLISRINELVQADKHGNLDRFITPNERLVELEYLGSEIANFAAENGWPADKNLTFAGKNFAGFDKVFLQMANGFSVKKPKHRSLDPGSMYWVPDDGAEPPSLNECLKRAGVDGTVAHRAVADALDVIKCIRRFHKIPLRNIHVTAETVHNLQQKAEATVE